MNPWKISFNRPLKWGDLWGLRGIFFIIFIRLCRPKISANIFRFLLGCILKKDKVSHMPLYMVLEPSSRCNLSCKMCWRSLYKTNRVESDMPYDNLTRVIDKIGDYLIFVVLWNYGEPLLNPNLDRMIEYCSKKGIITVLSTNGNLLSKERSLGLFSAGLKYLIVCVDAVTDDIYQKYRGAVKLSEIKNNIVQACKLRKENKLKFPVIELQFIVMRENEHQVDDFLLMAYSWGVDRASLKKFSALLGSGPLDEFMPLNNNYLLDCYKKPGSIRKGFCFVPWQSLVINSDGWVLPCCSDYFCTEKMGNILEEDISQIWNNSRCIKFRRQIKHDINSIDICRDCPHDSGQSGSFVLTKQF